MRQFEHATPMDQAESLAISVGHALDLVIKAKGWAVLAVSGGKSPLPMFERLRYRPIRWDAVTVTLVDERAVPPDHADSNGALVRNHLLREGAGVAAWVPLIRDEAEAAEPQRAVARLNGAFQQPDVVVLGMGEDGHTASLFPDAPELQDALSDPTPAYVVTHPSVAPHARVTLNLAALLAAERMFLAISGEKKAEVLARALQAPTPSLPVSVVLARHRRGVDIFRT
ncbi:MAG: 6-phosphogluconolactonase [Cupriavidus sp.]|uniref:6-phosphogluconolactonase n=1 Tax=Cupriavidus pauculus TaxID=82633 RepID=UPI000783ED60|nr:6-phosphogluconolactonase [Cupriavidus pauculus]MBU66089.1 6-phosphogluconolactonase [Cupriavidus sp.]KAB0600691.1 6-phosphogluconolactonase [Cupriavidus pauculus]MBY4733068.1 6-phosphogluconolactonase [Cupriavidus pauculus]MCM3607642.1 6-phosphogluconolactonase [Cupriavidus pauculus]UAL03469.1 6-phosphogluconolactonase [Cupriavidus pauculus]